MNGERHWQSVNEHTREEFGGWLDLLVHASGREFQHQEKDHHTEHPSIQGMWNPYVHTDPKVAVAQFPSVRLKGFICSRRFVVKHALFPG